MWFTCIFKGTVQRPRWTGASPNCARSFHPNICGVRKTSRKRLVGMKTNQWEPLGLIPAPLLLTGSVRCQPLIQIPPAQLALPFVPALYLCLRFVPAFKGNNYSCALPPSSEQTLIKICVRSNNVCMDPHRAQLNVFVKVWSASSYLLIRVTTKGHDYDRKWGEQLKSCFNCRGCWFQQSNYLIMRQLQIFETIQNSLGVTAWSVWFCPVGGAVMQPRMWNNCGLLCSLFTSVSLHVRPGRILHSYIRKPGKYSVYKVVKKLLTLPSEQCLFPNGNNGTYMVPAPVQLLLPVFLLHIHPNLSVACLQSSCVSQRIT